MKSLMPQIDSNDGLFHNGNPAKGEQGTRVTDTWLNNLQDRVRDVQAEAHYVLKKAGFRPVENKQTQLYEAIVKIIDDNRKTASLTQKGEVRLTSDTGLDSEELGLTAKAGKKLAQLIATVQLALNNYIPLNKRSSAVNSNDENNVATSKAVKTAYDKGVEAKTAADAAQRTANDGVSKADAAQTSANTANNNANGRVPKTGDTTINGILRAKNTSGGWSAYQFETSEGYWQLEVHPNSHEAANRRFNMLFNPNIGNRVYLSFPALGDDGEVVAYRSWAVNKTGDTMTGILRTVGIASSQFGFGSYAQQYTSGAPFMVESTGSKDRDAYHPFVKGLVRSKGHYGAGFSFGYTTKQGNGDGFGRGIINLVEDNGTSKNWGFEHNGDFNSAGDVRSSGGKSLNKSVSIDDFSQNLSNNGWCKLPNGLILQWGGSTNANILFPIAFPTVCLAVSHSKTGTGRDTRIESVSRTGFKSVATGSVGTTYYIAVGK